MVVIGVAGLLWSGVVYIQGKRIDPGPIHPILEQAGNTRSAPLESALSVVGGVAFLVTDRKTIAAPLMMRKRVGNERKRA